MSRFHIAAASLLGVGALTAAALVVGRPSTPAPKAHITSLFKDGCAYPAQPGVPACRAEKVALPADIGIGESVMITNMQVNDLFAGSAPGVTVCERLSSPHTTNTRLSLTSSAFGLYNLPDPTETCATAATYQEAETLLNGKPKAIRYHHRTAPKHTH